MFFLATFLASFSIENTHFNVNALPTLALIFADPSEELVLRYAKARTLHFHSPRVPVVNTVDDFLGKSFLATYQGYHRDGGAARKRNSAVQNMLRA